MAWYEYWFHCIRYKYFSFGGRATRSEYWYFLLFNVFLGIIFGIALGIAPIIPILGLISTILISLTTLITLIPGIAVTCRRLHDAGKSAWWFLINFLPIIGPLIFLYFLIKDSQQETNKYGVNPKA